MTCVPPRSYVQFLTPNTRECDLMWKEVFVDVMNQVKDLEMKSPWVRVAAKSNGRGPYKRQKRDTHREEGRALPRGSHVSVVLD